MKHTVGFIAVVFVLMLGSSSRGFGQWTQTNLNYKGNITCLSSSGKNINAGTSDSGLYYSDDMGITWFHSQNYKTGTIRCLTYIDGNFFIGINTRAIAGNSNYLFEEKTFNGILRSSDNGKSWTTVYSLTDEYVHALAVNSTNIFAGTWEYGIYRSTDNGLSWSKSNNGLLNTYINVFCILGDKIFAGSNGGGVFLSIDNASNWKPMNNGLDDTFINSLVARGNVLFAGTEYGGVFISTDFGESWKVINSGLTDTLIMSLSLSNDYLLAGIGSPSGNEGTGVWRRPLSDFGISAVQTQKILTENISSFPNPLTSKTAISFSNEQREFVSVSIVDMLGKECAKLFSGELDPGSHSYEWDASHNPPGMYLCTIRLSGVMKQIPVMVVR